MIRHQVTSHPSVFLFLVLIFYQTYDTLNNINIILQVIFLLPPPSEKLRFAIMTERSIVLHRQVIRIYKGKLLLTPGPTSQPSIPLFEKAVFFFPLSTTTHNYSAPHPHKKLAFKMAWERIPFSHNSNRAFIFRPIIPIRKLLLSGSVAFGVYEPVEREG